MTEQTGSSQPPDWYNKPPAWLTDPPPRSRDRYRDDRDDDYRGRSWRRDRDDEDLVTAIRAMPEQVVSALKEAIQGAQQSQQSQQNSGQQEQSKQDPPKQQDSDGGDDKPREQLSFADRWFSNQL